MLTKLFILISIILTLISFKYPEIIQYWMHVYFLKDFNYINFLIQVLLFQFLHWWIMHLLSNSLFLVLFWLKVEKYLGFKKYITLFIFSSFVSVIWLLLLSWNNITIWISWFTLSILAYYTFWLSRNKKEFNAWLIYIWINILIWFGSNISLIWHLLWVISWVVFYFLIKRFKFV